ncbi:MAG: hypothetical protein VYD64_09115 [Pseudomonadota bacterium]|nr:hypothetical protein [Pseudomonadota bacterium]
MRKITRKNASRAGAILAIASVTVAACTVHPTPTGFGFTSANDSVANPNRLSYFQDLTSPIVRKIRCEARDVIVQRAAETVAFAARQQLARYKDTNEAAQSLLRQEIRMAEEIQDDPSAVRNYGPWDIQPEVYAQFGPFMNAAIGYTFDLTVKEKNVNSVDPAFNASHGPHVLTLGVANHKIDAARQNKRTFGLVDVNMEAYQRLDCPQDHDLLARTGAKLGYVDWAYPMHGSIGFKKTFDAFERLIFDNTDWSMRSEWAKLALSTAYMNVRAVKTANLNSIESLRERARNCPDGSEICTADRICYVAMMKDAFDVYSQYFYDPPTGLEHKGPAPSAGKLLLTDKLTFTTQVDGGLNPEIKFSNATGAFRLNMLGFSVTGQRIDTHDVEIQIVAPKKTGKPSSSERLLKTASGYELLVKVPSKKKTAESDEPHKDCVESIRYALLAEAGVKPKRPSPPVVIMDTPEGPRQMPPPAAKLAADGLLISSEMNEAEKTSITQELVDDRLIRNLVDNNRRLRELTE